MSALKYYAIIVGGGSGSRMKSNIPKQFMLLKGKPVLMHTIEAFHSSKFNPEIIVVLNADFHQYWKDLCREYHFTSSHQLVSGGSHRFHSVSNGLKFVNAHSIIAIHDAVRPCISKNLVELSYKHAEEFGNAVVAIKSRDSVRLKSLYGSINIKREDIYLIQTPQVFRSEILNTAYQQEFRDEFTDDAAVVERSGVQIRLIEGDPKNIKITYPEDIRIAEVYLDSEN